MTDAAPAAPADANPGTASGIALDELDPTVRPQDDLFRHVNGKWIDRTEIPCDKARYGSFYLLAEEAEQAVRDIIVEAQQADPGTEERKIGDLFASFMDEERIEALGWEPLRASSPRSPRSPTSRPSCTPSARSNAPASAGSSAPSSTTTRATPSATWCSSSRRASVCPTSRTTARRSSPTSATAYLGYLERMLTLAGFDEAAERARTRPRPRDGDRRAPLGQRAHPRQPGDLQPADAGTRRPRSRSASPLDAWLAGLDAPAGVFDEVVVREPSFVEGVASLLVEDRLDAWRDWLRWQVIRSVAAVPARRGRRDQLRLLRQDAHRHPRAARPLEARRLARRGLARRGGRQGLRRAALQPEREDRDGRAGRLTSSRRTASHHRPSTG